MGAVIAIGAIAAVAGTGASVAAGNITSAQIKDGTTDPGCSRWSCRPPQASAIARPAR